MDARGRVVKHASKFQPPLRCGRQSMPESFERNDFDEIGREIGRREGKRGRTEGKRGWAEWYFGVLSP